MIAAEDKDWTWVLDRRCPDCGFDTSACTEARVAGLTRETADAWVVLLEHGKIRSGRPNASTWSSLEYACHVRDVFRRFERRIALMQTEDDPRFPNWDQDASAVADRYDEQDPTHVVEELCTAAHVVAGRLDTISGDTWTRPGRRSDGASFTIGTIARYMVHDPIHHIWDVNQQAGR
jgi:DinB superfamily